jgi:hypothetical protein
MIIIGMMMVVVIGGKLHARLDHSHCHMRIAMQYNTVQYYPLESIHSCIH